jgi:hypothetical protein
MHLYNIENDPREEEDLIEKFPNIVEIMLKRLEYYEQGMISSHLPDIDTSADPSLHDGFWQPWK